MKTTIEAKELIQIPGVPRIPGLTFRRFRGESDYPIMLEIINGCREADHLDYTDTLEDITLNYAHLERCDPYQDMVFVEVDDEPIAYSRIWWDKELNGDHIYTHFFYLLPVWREKGIGRTLVRYNEKRLRAVASIHPSKSKKYFQVWSSDARVHLNNLLEALNYEVIRYGYEMTRPVDAPLPDAPMPEGLEVRPVKPEHYDLIWDAMMEAFRDHWGFVPPTENDRQHWEQDRYFQPDIWKVGWDGEEVAGMVLNFVNQQENKEFNRLRGYTEGISVRRPWRRRGLARSLLVQSIEMFSEMGMEETCLGVDTNNPNGALNLYSGVGYKPIKTGLTYRKSFETTVE